MGRPDEDHTAEEDIVIDQLRRERDEAVALLKRAGDYISGECGDQMIGEDVQEFIERRLDVGEGG